LVQLRSSLDEGVTGPIDGTLVEGNFTSSDFTGLLDINQMSDVIDLIFDEDADVRVQTKDVPLGEIVGKITPNLLSWLFIVIFNIKYYIRLNMAYPRRGVINQPR
jgi:hypothetical protein